jgi:serine phosphatase RsbU (regulator of sigma subunit)/CHASE3 domain sensor protein
MGNRSNTTLIGAALTLLVVLALLIGGGLSVRGLITSTFDQTTQLRETLGLSRQTLVAQLDEETGIRGYAASGGDRSFLEPYDRAIVLLPGLLTRLEQHLAAADFGDAHAHAVDAAAANSTWLRTVAAPILAPHTAEAMRATEVAGKTLVDRYRADIDAINADVAARQVQGQTNVRSAIDRINFFIALAAVLVAVIGAFFLEVQRRTGARIERERVRAEREQREAQTLRAAYDAEKRIADSLQEAIAQRPLPTLPTLRFSATYVPATEETKVGGDWYDALELPNNRVLFAIGDVTGHGIEAAVTMNRARQALISSALLEGDPAAVLGRVNDEMYRQNAPLVTAVAGFADAGTYEFVYSTAGHPPPLLIEPGRRPRLLDCGSLPLGALSGTRYVLHRIQSVPGATLVLYTDGAVEHSRNVIEGEELLIEAAAGAAEHRSEDTASYIHQTIFNGRPVGDDVAILTISFATGATNGMRISADDAQSGFVGRLGGRVVAPNVRPIARRGPRPAARLESIAS